MVCGPRPMLNVWVTVGAALYFASPAWLASIAHVPATSSVTTLPLTLHAVDAVEKTTGLPEPPPVADRVNGGSVASRSGSAPKTIVCVANAIENDCVTVGAAS